MFAPAAFELRGEVGGAVQALLLAGEGGEDDRRLHRVGGEHARELEHGVDADASSLAPGASSVKFMTSVTRES